MKLLDKIQHPKKKAFLKAYCECGSITKAASASKIDRTTHYFWMHEDSDEEYAKAFNLAQQMAGDNLEEVLWARAKAGETTELIFALKGLKPERYRERYDVRGTIDMPSVNINFIRDGSPSGGDSDQAASD